MADLSPLRRRMIEDRTVRNLSPATQRSYISAVSKFSRYFERSACGTVVGTTSAPFSVDPGLDRHLMARH